MRFLYAVINGTSCAYDKETSTYLPCESIEEAHSKVLDLCRCDSMLATTLPLRGFVRVNQVPHTPEKAVDVVIELPFNPCEAAQVVHQSNGMTKLTIWNPKTIETFSLVMDRFNADRVATALLQRHPKLTTF